MIQTFGSCQYQILVIKAREDFGILLISGQLPICTLYYWSIQLLVNIPSDIHFCG